MGLSGCNRLSVATRCIAWHICTGTRLPGESTRAMDCFRHALYLKADFVPAYINLGNVLHIVGQLEEAVQVSARRTPTEPLPHLQ